MSENKVIDDKNENSENAVVKKNKKSFFKTLFGKIVIIILGVLLFFVGLEVYVLLTKKHFTSSSRYLEESFKVSINGVEFKMIKVKGGTFQMGSSMMELWQECKFDINHNFVRERPVHEVTLSDYYISEREVSQELYDAVMSKPEDSRFPEYVSEEVKQSLMKIPKQSPTNKVEPIDRLSWEDCQRFIVRLNEISGKNYSLPTEAQWEYAARGGAFGRNCLYSGTDYKDETDVCPNELGIYGMSNNIPEWCNDWYGEYSSGKQIDPKGPKMGTERVMRNVYSKSVSSRYTSNWGGFRLVILATDL